MKTLNLAPWLFVFLLAVGGVSFAETPNEIRLPGNPVISPDGTRVAFDWQNDIWTADIAGGEAVRVTVHAATDHSPMFSPDGQQLYFSSDRTGRDQIHVMPLDGGRARQITFDSHGKTLRGITPDGRHLLITQTTDRGWHYSESSRAFLIDTLGEQPKQMLFDAGVRDAALSPDGTKVLFVRGRSSWSRKGYKGPQAAQLWLADLSQQPAKLTRLSKDRERFQNVAEADPIWAPDGRGYYYKSDPDSVFDIYYRELDSDTARQVTNVSSDGVDDGVAFLSLARAGNKLLMRRGFDLFVCDPQDGKLQQVKLTAGGDQVASPLERVESKRAQSIAFTADGKQMAFVAGDEIFVMDRILKEPVRVTRSAHPETDLIFNHDGSRLFFVSDAGGEADIWEATHDREDGIWWMADKFKLRQVTDDRDVEGQLALSPNGTHVAYTKGSNLYVMDDDGSDHRRVAKMWSQPEFDWSPDGKWLTYATEDDNYNSDIFIVPLDGSRDPFNLSRHPDLDMSPKWSGDGKRIAWVGRHEGSEADIYVVELTKATDEETERDELLKKALEEMEKSAKAKKDKSAKKAEGKDDDDTEEEPKSDDQNKPDDSKDDKKDEEESVEVKIDFEDIFARIDRIRYSDTFEWDLIWVEDGATLAFSATIDGKEAFYRIKFPRPEKPEKIADSPLGSNRWLDDSKQFVGRQDGVPATMSLKGKTEKFEFTVRTQRDWREIRQVAFDQGWRAMRDHFYDEAYNNKDWYAIRDKYRPVAAQCVGAAEFSELMNMMLGELNASHMGHYQGRDPLPDFDAQHAWSPRTYHLGLRFKSAAPADESDQKAGAGLVVESVIPGSPCARARSLVKPGEVLLKIDDAEVGPDVDVDKLLTLDRATDLTLRVRSAAGVERDVVVRPVTSVGGLLYDEWTEKTRKAVEALSDGQLGYLHIRGMNMSSFRQMEADLYHAGVGKAGLLIDVRFNGGGSTADHVMTALTQPVHAITRSRGSGEGYPQDRRIYASWTKPIVLLCNEHSFSNAEIVSHAIKQTGRGRLVGMRTAGGVISTGSRRLMDGSSMRMPTRGWYLVTTGEDMELNGCEPHIALWNEPTWNSPGGTDTQLKKAVEALQEDVAAEKAKGRARIVPASKLRVKR